MKTAQHTLVIGIRTLEPKSQMSSGGDFFNGEKDGCFRMGCKDQLLLLPRSLVMRRPEHQGPPLSFLNNFFFVVFKNNLFNLFYFWLCWVFVAACGLSLVAVSGGYSSLRCMGFSLRWLLLLRSTGSRHAGFSSCSPRA